MLNTLTILFNRYVYTQVQVSRFQVLLGWFSLKWRNKKGFAVGFFYFNIHEWICIQNRFSSVLLNEKNQVSFPVHLLSICLYMHLSANLLHFEWKIKIQDQTFLKGRSNYQYVNRVGHLELEYLLLKNYCTRKQHFYI